jgi:hypothetical protein
VDYVSEYVQLEISNKLQLLLRTIKVINPVTGNRQPAAGIKLFIAGPSLMVKLKI